MTPPCNRRSNSRRRGMTMIETMVLMTAVAVMLGMTVIVLQLAMKLDADGRGRLERSTALDRLSRRFRADVHAARAIETAETSLIFETTPNRSIRYDAAPEGKITRWERIDDKIAAREAFVIPQTGTTRLSVREIDGRPFAVMELDTLVRKNRIDPARTLEFLAVVGKDRRRSTTKSEAEGGKP